MTTYRDYDGQIVQVGDSIRSLETNWHGEIVDVMEHDGIIMLECQGINHWDQSLDEDDVQWFSPEDTRKANRIANPVKDGVNAINMM